MKFHLQILFFFITWFSNLSATPAFIKVAFPRYEFSISKTENINEEGVAKIGVQIPRVIGIARSEITENEPQTASIRKVPFFKTLFSNDENGNFSSLTSEEYQSNASLMAQQQELATAIDIIWVIGSVGGASGTAVYNAVNKLNQMGEFGVKIGKSTWSQGKTLFKTLVVSRGLRFLKVVQGAVSIRYGKKFTIKLSSNTSLTTIEKSIAEESHQILNSPEFKQITDGFANKIPVQIEINGRTISYDDAPFSGMTWFEKNGFNIGREAFVSEEELIKTVLHEMHRLKTSTLRGSGTAAQVSLETQAAFNYANKTFNLFE